MHTTREGVKLLALTAQLLSDFMLYHSSDKVMAMLGGKALVVKPESICTVEFAQWNFAVVLCLYT